MRNAIVLLIPSRFKDDKGLYRLNVHQDYMEALHKAGCLPIILGAALAKDTDKLLEICDGLCVPGGAEDIAPDLYKQERIVECGETDPWRDNLEITVASTFLKARKPYLGICRGMQLLNVALGGTLIQDLPSQKGWTHPLFAVHEVETEESSILARLFGHKFQVNSIHHQAIDILGEGLRPVAFSERGKLIEAVEHREFPFLGVQWHPERMTQFDSIPFKGPNMEVLFTYFASLCTL